MAKSKRPPIRELCVAIVGNFAHAYNRGILRGAAAAVEEFHHARLYHCDHVQAQTVLESRQPKFDRVLLGACEPSLRLPALFAAGSIRTVDTSGEVHPPPLPRVIADDVAVGRLAAEYFLERGFSHYLFFGYKEFYWSNLRLEGYRGALARRGKRPTVHLTADGAAWNLAAIAEKIVGGTVSRSDSPVAIFCANDCCAVMVVEACLHAKIQIPEQAAVLGVDDDELLTCLREPNISSIQLNCYRIGYEAMQHLLADKPSGKAAGRAAPRTILIPPLSVASRRSTDIIAVEDALVRRAIAFIRDHLHEGMNIKMLLYALGVSRTTLETRFKRQLGRPPAEEVRRQRLLRASEMLASGESTIGDIGRRVGFSSAQLFSESFCRYKKMTPLAYRKTMRVHAHHPV